MNTFFLFLTFILLGYYLSICISHPTKRKRQLPTISFKNIEISPNVRLHFRNKTYWFHHWFYLSVLVVATFLVYDNVMHYASAKAAAGAAMGGIFQGLRYPDRFKFRHPRQKA